MPIEESTGCPSEEQLAGYVTASCPPEAADAIAAHAEACAACRQWLEEAKQEDPFLDSLRRILDADARAVTAAPALRGAAPELPRIEGYEILDELGRGGMGAVYLAVQQSTRRKVALKVLLEGPFASESAKRRFQREVELAAQLDHPHIVTILESGVASGRYYFAMQYVEGRRLTDYVAGRNLPMRHRLELFASLCEAVSYAHQRGVIHRDLKPSNILVDGHGNPHILDFGLAKPSDSDDRDARQVSELSITGQIIGTLPYMSPEQTLGDSRQIDIRSDVYSLGVILYEVLTGGYPYAVVGQVTEVLRNINEAKPKRPSTVEKRVDNEVETIILKSLAKERERRYQSAAALGEDVQRYLAGKAIDAKRDSGWYVTRKLLRRYRMPIGLTCAFIGLLLTGVGLTLVQGARLEVAQAVEVLAGGVNDPAGAVKRTQNAGRGVRSRAAAIATSYVSSAVYTERIAGARLGLWLAPDEFWRSVDGGPLWNNGEWLEVSSLPADLVDAIMPQLRDKAQTGTPRQRYVALCLIGQLAGRADPALAELCVRVAESDAEPGVAAAARWAAGRQNAKVACSTRDGIFADDLSKLVYYRVPGCAEFRRGSTPDDPDRLADEDPPKVGVAIQPFFLAETEVTWPAFDEFAATPAGRETLTAQAAERLAAHVERLAPEDRPSMAVGYLSLNTARRFCEWLTERGRMVSPPRRYRLPTEDEWEYACRAENAGRFCFGSDVRYVRYFANCDGTVSPVHIVGRHMPNWFGLSDMHGGLWERCDTRYPPERIEDPQWAGRELWVYRGGAYHSPAVRCRSAQRNYGDAGTSSDYHGCRLVMELLEP